MDRKQFLTFFAATGIASQLQAASINKPSGEKAGSRIPAYLKPGDTIGITSPASYISAESIRPSIQLMQNWGFKIETGKTIGTRDFILGGSDEARTADLQQMLDNPAIKAIMCARGGYGLIRIIDQLNFSKFKSDPKWIIGFSDVTVLHAHINSNFGIASIHSKMCNSFPGDWTKASPEQIATILSIRQVLSGADTRYTAPSNSANRPGRAEGILVGGNLSILEGLAGSSSDLSTAGKILFIEDTHEEPYRIDRMCWNLKRSGKLDKLKGLVIGGFRFGEETPGEEFGKTITEIVSEKVKTYGYPVCFEFPVGHQVNNYALKCGTKYLLEVTKQGSALTSIL